LTTTTGDFAGYYFHVCKQEVVDNIQQTFLYKIVYNSRESRTPGIVKIDQTDHSFCRKKEYSGHQKLAVKLDLASTKNLAITSRKNQQNFRYKMVIELFFYGD
jgi:hypothetical protein